MWMVGRARRGKAKAPQDEPFGAFYSRRILRRDANDLCYC